MPREIDTVTVIMSASQARVVCQALELFSRIGCGQFWYLREVVTDYWPFKGGWRGDREEFNHLASELRRIVLPDLGGGNVSYSIANPKVPVAYRRGYDVQKEIEKAMAVARDPNPEFRNVLYDGALPCTEDPFVQVAVTLKEQHG